MKYIDCGIYQIRNLVNGKIYIGSSTRIRERFSNHRSNLNRHVHTNPHLQAAWDKYGNENFIFEILVTCHSSMILFYEQQFIDQWKPEYNINILANKPNPRQYTDDEKEKVSREHKGKINSVETRERISKSRKGIKFSKTHIENLKKSHQGKKFSEETLLKMSLSQKERRIKEHEVFG